MAFSSPFSINTLVPSLSNLSLLPSPAIELHECIDLMKNNVENNDVDQNLTENLNLSKHSVEGKKQKCKTRCKFLIDFFQTVIIKSSA